MHFVPPPPLSVAKDYVRLMKYGDSLYRCKQLKRAALGRMCTILKRQKSSLEYLEQGNGRWHTLTLKEPVCSLSANIDCRHSSSFSAPASVSSAHHRPQHQNPAPLRLPQCRKVQFYQQGMLTCVCTTAVTAYELTS